jgi:hypothetical protein
VHQDTRREGTQDELVEARGQPQFGIRRGQQLSDPVEPETVDLLGRHPAADVRGGLQDRGRYSCAGQPMGRRESGDTGPHDDDVRLVRGLKHVPSLVRGDAAGQGTIAPTGVRDKQVRSFWLS